MDKNIISKLKAWGYTIVDTIIIIDSYIVVLMLFEENSILTANFIANIAVDIIIYNLFFTIFKLNRNIAGFEKEKDYLLYFIIGMLSFTIIVALKSLFKLPWIGIRKQFVANFMVPIQIIMYKLSIKLVRMKLLKKKLTKIKVLPCAEETIKTKKTINCFRDVRMEDILGRAPIKLSNNNIKKLIENNTILVTGGGGSIGSELCRQIVSKHPSKIIIFDIYENNLYNIEQEIKFKHPEIKVEAIVGSVRDTNRLEMVFGEYKPFIVFHAAAHKHVPLMEKSPLEAIKNNIFGTYNVAKMADKYGVNKFVLISTDKAVNPTNIMGATKRMCEMIIQAMNEESKTDYVAVRFGNVIGSNGSVVPLFKKQIKEGGPITVTHKEITRFFMTIPEAVSLIIEAATYAHGGEIFVLDMGEPVKIYDLAKNLIKLYGLELGVDIDIKFTGLRPGEKLYEELLMAEEGLKKTSHDKIFVARPMHINMNQIEEKISVLRKLIADKENKEIKITENEIKDIIRKVVPTFKEPEEVNNLKKSIQEKVQKQIDVEKQKYLGERLIIPKNKSGHKTLKSMA